jgi:hypothetical protein
MRVLLCCLALLAAGLPAQPPAPPPAQPPAPQPASATPPAPPAADAAKTPPVAGRGLVPIDRVIATVNDSAILLSELRGLAAGQVAALEQRLGRPLSAQETELAYREVLLPLIEKHAMAQAARTFGILPPEQVEAIFNSELAREEAEQMRDYGTWQQFSKDLELSGRTWQSYVRERRVEKLRDLAEEVAVQMRLAQQRNLYVTPRMLWEAWQEYQSEFRRGPRADVGIVSFEGPDGEANASAAAAQWRELTVSPQELLDRLNLPRATAQVRRDLSEASRGKVADEIVDFALPGPQHAVSAPFRLGSAWRVAKVLNHAPARNANFEDAEVQALLRQICQRGVVESLKRQAVERAMQRTEYWSLVPVR